MSDLIYDERVICAFLNNYRMTDIIRETGLSKNTVYKIRKDPRFQKILQERKDSIIKTAVAKMQNYLLDDIEVLQKIISDPNTAPQIKVNAIQVKLNQLNSWIQTGEIINRLERLENPNCDDFGTAEGVFNADEEEIREQEGRF